jgi:hypothetical protein
VVVVHGRRVPSEWALIWTPPANAKS